MGIPGLARRVEPYASHLSPQQLEGYSAIIDGPALAYYAHKLALAASGTPIRIPSYAAVVDQAIRWLNSLEHINIKVSKILFDGALPSSKRAERVSRLEQNNKRVQQLRASYPTTSCPIPTYLSSNLYAFLAPALKEALIGSTFASRTHVVPGEADDWCALEAKENARSVIFTSDTDLILYDYPPEALVVFLQDADLTASFRAYSPQQIRSKLQVKSLVTFAFAIRQEPSNIAGDLIRFAQNVNLESEEYIAFSKRYTVQVVTPAFFSTRGCMPHLQTLDVRVSEFVHQTLDGCLASYVYLPLLVEDPNQASAWTIGQDIRILAYSLLAPRNSNINEYKRKAQGIAVQQISTLSVTKIQAVVAEFYEQVRTLKTWASSKALGAGAIWLLFALSLVLADMSTPPSVTLAMRILNGDFDNTWAFIQLTARVQAALSSLRMLNQIIVIWLAINDKSDSKLFDDVSGISSHMKDFPSIIETFVVIGQKPNVIANHEELRKIVEEIYVSAGAEIPEENTSNRKKKRQLREADRKKRKADPRQQQTDVVSNSFSILHNQ